MWGRVSRISDKVSKKIKISSLSPFFPIEFGALDSHQARCPSLRDRCSRMKGKNRESIEFIDIKV